MADDLPGATMGDANAGLEPLNLDPTKFKVYYNQAIGGKRIVIYTNAERLMAWLWIQPISQYFEVSYQEIETAIETTNIAVSQKRMADINEFLHKLREVDRESSIEEISFEPMIIGEGKASVDGEDGWFEWHITEPDPKKLNFTEDSQGRIDFREMNLVINVNQDDPLVTIHEPTKGEPGYDVFGNAIPARHGESKRLGVGKGVKLVEKEATLYAEISGHVENKNGILSVSPVYLVQGSVDFSVGNINFRGAVIVIKDVTEGFTVRATDGIKVHGMVTQASLFCDQDIEIVGGVTSQADKGFIEAGGRLLAKYLVNAKVDCRGDVLIDTQIVNCDVVTSGKVIMPRGRLVGGSVVALGGIEANEIGAQIGTRTQLVVSIESFETAETRAIDADIQAKEKVLEKLEGLLGPFIRDRSLLNQLPPDKMDQVLQHIQKIDELQSDISRLHDERREALEPFAASMSDTITVHKAIHAGVDVRIDNARQVFSESISGPIQLKPNYQRGTIAIHAYNAGRSGE